VFGWLSTVRDTFEGFAGAKRVTVYVMGRSPAGIASLVTMTVNVAVSPATWVVNEGFCSVRLETTGVPGPVFIGKAR
jgi:hypothetical protein